MISNYHPNPAIRPAISPSPAISEREIPSRTRLRQHYYHLPKENWDDPFNKLLRNALFDEPLERKVNSESLLRENFKDFTPDTFQSNWQRQLKVKPLAESKIEISSFLSSKHACQFVDDYYTNCISAKGNFLAFADCSDTIKVFKELKKVDEFSLNFNMFDHSLGAISALQVTEDANVYFGDVRGFCYKVSLNSSRRAATAFDRLNPDAQISSMALDQSFLYTSDKMGKIVVSSLQQREKIFNHQFLAGDFVCRILPPVKGDFLMALGHNSNHVSVWDLRNMSTSVTTEETHQAGVRALDWNPNCRHEIASGGGVNDRTILIWDASSGRIKHQTFTNSQICNLFWNTHQGKTYLTTVNGYSVDSSEGRAGLKVFSWNDRALTLEKFIRLESNFRPVHSAIDGVNPNRLFVGGRDYLEVWKFFEPRKKPLRNVIEERFGQLSIR